MAVWRRVFRWVRSNRLGPEGRMRSAARDDLGPVVETAVGVGATVTLRVPELTPAVRR